MTDKPTEFSVGLCVGLSLAVLLGLPAALLLALWSVLA